MLNIIWVAIIVFSAIFMIACGNATEFTTILYEGVDSAVELSISLVGIMAFWGGLMEIGEKSGLTEAFAKIFSPVFKFLFPKVKDNKNIKTAISMNITANMLGLGNAATPLGVEAMKRLHHNNGKSPIADASMITFVIINTASVQLVPVTTAALRAKYGSTEPMIIAIPVLLASFMSLFVGLAADKVISGFKNKRYVCR